MDILLAVLLLLIPVVLLALLIMFIVSLIFFLISPKGSQKRGTWKVLAIVFGALSAAMILFVLAIMIIMISDITHM